MITEQERVKILRLADKAAKDLETEAYNLPKPLVWTCCKTLEDVKNMKARFERCIMGWTRRLPGSEPFVRAHFLGLIQGAQRELKEIDMVLETLNQEDQ